MREIPPRRRGASAAVEERLRRLDRRLHIDHRGRSEWVWAGPALTFLGTLALVLVLGVRSGLDAVYFAPIGVILAVVMAGMSIAYMTPEADVEGGDGGPPPSDDRPTAPLAPDMPPVAAWWNAEDTAEEPAPSRERPPREPAGRR